MFAGLRAWGSVPDLYRVFSWGRCVKSLVLFITALTTLRYEGLSRGRKPFGERVCRGDPMPRDGTSFAGGCLPETDLGSPASCGDHSENSAVFSREFRRHCPGLAMIYSPTS